MGLTILANHTIKSEVIFNNVILSAVKAKLIVYLNKDIYHKSKDTDFFDINIQNNYGESEESEEFFFMDIHSEKYVKHINQTNLLDIQFKGNKYYALAGTDNAPSHLCYDFSLAYLRHCPEHLISIYDEVFSLAEIEYIENNSGWSDNWLKDLISRR